MNLSDAKITVQILENILIKANENIAAFAGNDNPQVKEMMIKEKAEKELVESVLSAMNGNFNNLRCH